MRENSRSFFLFKEGDSKEENIHLQLGSFLHLNLSFGRLKLLIFYSRSHSARNVRRLQESAESQDSVAFIRQLRKVLYYHKELIQGT